MRRCVAISSEQRESPIQPDLVEIRRLLLLVPEEHLGIIGERAHVSPGALLGLRSSADLIPSEFLLTKIQAYFAGATAVIRSCYATHDEAEAA